MRVAAFKFKPLHRQRPSRLFSSVFLRFLSFAKGITDLGVSTTAFYSKDKSEATAQLIKNTTVEKRFAGAIKYSRDPLFGQLTIVYMHYLFECKLKNLSYFFKRKIY